jgi:hypothetical protein
VKATFFDKAAIHHCRHPLSATGDYRRPDRVKDWLDKEMIALTPLRRTLRVLFEFFQNISKMRSAFSRIRFCRQVEPTIQEDPTGMESGGL